MARLAHFRPLAAVETDALLDDLARRSLGMVYLGLRAGENNRPITDFNTKGDRVWLSCLFGALQEKLKARIIEQEKPFGGKSDGENSVIGEI